MNAIRPSNAPRTEKAAPPPDAAPVVQPKPITKTPTDDVAPLSAQPAEKPKHKPLHTPAATAKAPALEADPAHPPTVKGVNERVTQALAKEAAAIAERDTPEAFAQRDGAWLKKQLPPEKLLAIERKGHSTDAYCDALFKHTVKAALPNETEKIAADDVGHYTLTILGQDDNLKATKGDDARCGASTLVAGAVANGYPAVRGLASEWAKSPNVRKEDRAFLQSVADRKNGPVSVAELHQMQEAGFWLMANSTGTKDPVASGVEINKQTLEAAGFKNVHAEAPFPGTTRVPTHDLRTKSEVNQIATAIRGLAPGDMMTLAMVSSIADGTGHQVMIVKDGSGYGLYDSQPAYPMSRYATYETPEALLQTLAAPRNAETPGHGWPIIHRYLTATPPSVTQ